MIVTYTEMISLVGRYTGSIRGQPERVTGIGFCNICLDTDIRIVDQPGETIHDLAVRISFVDIELEFIVHIVDRNIKGVGRRGKRGSQIREKISQVLLRGGQFFYLKIKFRRSTCQSVGTDVGCFCYFGVCGISTFFTEHAVLLQTAELCDRVMKLTGIFLQRYGIVLCVLVGGRKIPGSIFVQFYNGIIYAAEFAFFMCVILRQLSGRICRQIVVVYRVENSTHRYLLSPP